VLGGYGEDAVGGENASMAIEEGAGRRSMAGIAAIEMVDALG